MILHTAFILWLIMLALVVNFFIPFAKWKWGKLVVWLALALFSLLVHHMHVLTFS